MELELLLQQRAVHLARLRARAAQVIEDLRRYPQDDPPTREVVELGGTSKIVYNHTATRIYVQWLLGASDEELLHYADCHDEAHLEQIVFGSSPIQ